MVKTVLVQKKRSFCRYYLRGLCVFDVNECSFSHGVHDLQYIMWRPEQVIEFDYLKQTDFTQKVTIKGPRVYKDLYQFQKYKKYTLGQLNQDREKRFVIRKQLHRKLFIDFMKLLEQKHPAGEFTEQFLVRQYTRVGFNKLMTSIKFSHLTTHLCSDFNSQYFQFSVIMPPHVKSERVFVVKKAKHQQIDGFYKNTYQKVLKDHPQEVVEESKMKRLLFNFTKQSIHIPPLNVHLKNMKLSFAIYLKSLLGQDIVGLQMKLEADIPALLQSSKKYLCEQLPTRLVEWKDIYKFLAKQHQINNGTVINQLKPLLAVEGYRFLFFPMIQFIIHPKIPLEIDLNSHQQCPCRFKKIFDQEQLSILTQAIHNQAFLELQPKQSYDVYDLQSFLLCARFIYNREVLGVDIEGRLRKNGYIQMIQLNNGTNTFLIDIYRMDLNGDVTTFQLTKKLLRNVLVNGEILKIFHDCRHDSLALHQFMECCIKNVYDTSASQTYKGQLQVYKKLDQILQQQLDQDDKNYQKKRRLKQQKGKQAVTQVSNVKTPGLNQILKTYNAPHGINKNKQLFHSMWGKGETSLFDQRPLNADFRQYCIKDVLDLPHIYTQMTKQSNQSQFNTNLAKWLSSQYVKYGYLSTHQGQKGQNPNPS